MCQTLFIDSGLEFLMQRMSAGATVISGLYLEMVYFQTHSYGCWSAQVLTSFWPETSVLFHVASLRAAIINIASSFSQSEGSTRKRNRENLTEATLVLLPDCQRDMLSLLPCSVLRWESVGPAHTQGEGITQGLNTRRGILGSLLETAYRRWHGIAKAELLCTLAISVAVHELATSDHWRAWQKCRVSGPIPPRPMESESAFNKAWRPFGCISDF